MSNPHFQPCQCSTVGTWAGPVGTAGYCHMLPLCLMLQNTLFDEPVLWMIQGPQSYYLFSAVTVSLTVQTNCLCALTCS